MKKQVNVKVYLEFIALVLMTVSLISGCCKVGKGARIHVTNNLVESEAKVPYPVIATALSTETIKVTYTTEGTFGTQTTETTAMALSELTTTEATTENNVDDIAVPISFADQTNIEDSMNDDVSEVEFETYDYGYYPSVANGYITEEERIYLCNTVGTEWGSDWVSLYDKAMVVDTVMTRVDEGRWTNGLESTVYNVLTAPNQYNPWYAEPYYHDNVTQSCIDAVEYYFQHRDEFPHYTSFYGDGVENHFYN